MGKEGSNGGQERNEERERREENQHKISPTSLRVQQEPYLIDDASKLRLQRRKFSHTLHEQLRHGQEAKGVASGSRVEHNHGKLQISYQPAN